MKKIRWGIIGCGKVTEVKSGPGFQKANNSELVAVMRRNGELAKDYAARHGVPKYYDQANDLIWDPDVDAVYIATPPANHKEYTLLCAQAKKPVYVEKPMAMDFNECNEMISACKNAGVPLFVAYYRRGLPRFHKIKEIINSGAIGEVRFVNILNYQKCTQDEKNNILSWRVMPEISGGGKFMDLGCHTLDIMDFIFGPVVNVSGIASNQAKLYKADDIVSATFKFSSGVHGTGVWCFNAFEYVDRNEIIGSKGKLCFSTFGAEPIQMFTEEGVEEFPVQNPPHIQQPLIQTIVDELTGFGVCPSHGESAARTSWVMDQIQGTVK